MEKLSLDNPQTLQDLTKWKRVEGREAITRTFSFSDFKEAFAWMNEVAKKAEEMNHHPEWLNIWNRGIVTLTTHDALGITTKDIILAQEMDRLYACV